MSKWEEWERVHAEEDARDLNVVIAVVTIVVVLVVVMSLTAS